MKLFLRRVLLFCLGCIFSWIILFIGETWILNVKGQFKLHNSEKYLFFGHSHAQMAINDQLIDSSLNLASSGEAYFYTYIKLRKILDENPDEKIVFIEYSNNNISSEMNKWIWDDMHVFDRYRLYNAYACLPERKVLYDKNPQAAFQCDIKSIINNCYYIFKLNHISTDGKMGGYFYLVRDKTDSLLRAMTTSPRQIAPDTTISQINLQYLKKIIALCRQHNDTVILFRSPLHPKYERLGNEKEFRKLLVTEFRDVEFIDFKDCSFLNSEYADLEHLNYRGAAKFSTFVNKLLQNGILNMREKQKYIDQQIERERQLMAAN